MHGHHGVARSFVLAQHLYASPLASCLRTLLMRSRDMSGTNMVLWPGTCPARPSLRYTTDHSRKNKKKNNQTAALPYKHTRSFSCIRILCPNAMGLILRPSNSRGRWIHVRLSTQMMISTTCLEPL